MNTRAISIEAYQANKPKAPAQRAAILEYIRSCGVDGAICDEIEVALGLPHQTASARCTELCKDGAIEHTGEVRKTRAGSRAMVYMAVGLC